MLKKCICFLSGLKKRKTELNKSFILKIFTTIKFNKGSLEKVSTLLLYSKYSTLFNSAKWQSTPPPQKKDIYRLNHYKNQLANIT